MAARSGAALARRSALGTTIRTCSTDVRTSITNAPIDGVRRGDENEDADGGEREARPHAAVHVARAGARRAAFRDAVRAQRGKSAALVRVRIALTYRGHGVGRNAVDVARAQRRRRFAVRSISSEALLCDLRFVLRTNQHSHYTHPSKVRRFTYQ
jgi:hypothetical protein